MANIVDLLKDSRNALLRSEAEDVELLKKIQESDRSEASKLKMLLNIGILDILLQTGNRCICTRNEVLVKLFSRIKDPKSRVEKVKQDIFSSNNKNLVLAWDLEHSKYVSIIVGKWRLFNFFTFKEDYAKDLQRLLNSVLNEG